MFRIVSVKNRLTCDQSSGEYVSCNVSLYVSDRMSVFSTDLKHEQFYTCQCSRYLPDRMPKKYADRMSVGFLGHPKTVILFFAFFVHVSKGFPEYFSVPFGVYHEQKRNFMGL